MMDEPGKLQAFNNSVRSLITLGLVAAFIYGFVISGKVSAEVFTNLVVLAVTWWFSRDQQKASSQEAINALKTPPPSGLSAVVETPSSTTIIGDAARKEPTP